MCPNPLISGSRILVPGTRQPLRWGRAETVFLPSLLGAVGRGVGKELRSRRPWSPVPGSLSAARFQAYCPSVPLALLSGLAALRTALEGPGPAPLGSFFHLTQMSPSLRG